MTLYNYNIVPKSQKTKIRMTPLGLVTRQHSIQYRAYCDVQTYTPDVAAQFSALTGINAFVAMTDDPVAWVNMLDVQDEETRNPWTYLIDVGWSTETPDPSSPEVERDDPFDDPIEIDIDGEVATLPLWRDINNNLIANTAGEPVTGLEQRREIEIVKFVRNEAVKNTARDRQFRGLINQYAWNGANAGTVLCRAISAKRTFRKRVEYWPYNYEFAYRADGWQPQILNAGLYQIKAGKREPCMDETLWEPVTEPVPLYGPMDIPPNAQIPSAALPGAARFNTFTTFGQIDFNALNLPQG